MFTAHIPASLKPYAKALNAALSAAAVIIVHGLFTGEWDLNTLESIVTVGLIGGVVFATPNG